jgi:hypothetical protein
MLLGQKGGRGVRRSCSSTQKCLHLDRMVGLRIRFCPVSTTPLRRSRTFDFKRDPVQISRINGLGRKLHTL